MRADETMIVRDANGLSWIYLKYITTFRLTPNMWITKK